VPDPALIGRAMTIQFTVIASAPGAGTPWGRVTISASGSSCAGALNSGAGSCSITLPNAGPTTLVASYPGDGNFEGSSTTAAHEVVYFKACVPLAAR
jgi:hypothetical protein